MCSAAAVKRSSTITASRSPGINTGRCAVAVCRTRVLGGHVVQCQQCGHTKPSYNSCRNRHCPKCQASARGAWLDARAAELLPVPYFHLVFTLPGLLGPLALQNKKAVYGILFRAAWETVRRIGQGPPAPGRQGRHA